MMEDIADMLSARQYLKFCAAEALGLYANGHQAQARVRFVSAVRRHPGSAWIADHKLTLGHLRRGCREGVEAFERAMLDFVVDGDEAAR